MRLRFLALVLFASAAATACGSEPVVPVDATPDADMTDALDLVQPDTTIDVKPPALTNVAPARFEFHSSEQATFKCRIDGGAEQPCTSPKMITGLADGNHTFEVRAVDTSNLEDPTPATHAWRIDTIPPETQLLETPPQLDNSTSVSITFEAPGEVGATFECGLDGAAFTTCASPFTADNLADGNHTFRVRAKDAAGNFDSTPAALNWQIDSVSPDTVIDTGPAGIVNAPSATFTFSSPGAGAGSTFSCHIDNTPFGPCVSPRTFDGLLDGQHTFEVRVTDDLGNTDPTPARRVWTIDSTGPTSSITVRPDNPSSDLTPTFEFTASEPSTFECQIDGQVPYEPCTSPYTSPAVPAGPRFFRVRATDQVGNRGPEATYEWVIDSSGPVLTISNGPSGAVASTTAIFNWNSSEPATFCYRFSGDAQDTCTMALAGSGTVTRPGLAQGAQTFTVTGTDALGNSGAPVVRNFTVDTVGPSVMITAGPMNTVGAIAQQFTFTSPEAATYCYKVDTGAELCTLPPGAMTATVTVNALDGAHTLEVVARDALGNRTAMPATRAWTTDTVRPTTTIMTAPAQNSVVGSGSTMVQLTASEASTICWRIGAGAETCSAAGQVAFTADLMNLPDGVVAFSARASDAVGAGPTVTRTWTVDTVRPTATITAGPAQNAIVGSSEATFIITSSELSQICWTFNGGAQACSPNGVTSFSPAKAGLPEGANTFSVFAKDAIGNGPSVDRMWTVDTARPTVAITAGPAAGSTQGNNTAMFSMTSNEAATICWRFDGGAESCSAAGQVMADATSAALGEGSHLFEVYGKDTVGSGAVVSRTWVVDTARPTMTITAGPAQGSTQGSTTASFTVSSSERATICWQFNNAAAVCTQPGQTSATATATNLPAGATTFSVTGADAVGAGVAATRNFTIDVTRPTVTIASPTEGQRINNAAPTITIVASESSTICWRLDGGAQTCSPAPAMMFDAVLAGLAQGDHTLTANASDAVGAGVTLTRSFIVDSVRPTVTIGAGPADGSTQSSTTASFSVAASEPSTICWKFNGGAQSCSAAGSLTATPQANGLAQGVNTFEVTASDTFGAGATVMRSWTVDTIRPTVTITAGPAQGSTTPNLFATFTVTSNQPASFCWRFNTGPLTCSAPGLNTIDITSNPLPPGNNVFSVTGSDAIGPGTAVVQQWTIDSARPTLSITAGPAQGSVDDHSNVSFTLAASEPATICYSFNGAMPTCSPPGQVTWNATANGLLDGPNVLTATGADNVGAGPVLTRNWTIDTTAPVVTISAPPAEGARTNLTSANFTINSNEPARICWALDGGAQTCSGTVGEPGVLTFNANLVNLTAGNHTLAVTATDGTNHTTNVSRVWTVDLTAPTVTIGTPPAQNSFSNQANPMIALSSSEPSVICWTLDGVMPATCSAPGAVNFNASLMNLTAGSHTLVVTAQDEATNTGNASRTWTVDLTPAIITISGPPNQGQNDSTLATVNFTITTDEPADICWNLDTGSVTCSPPGMPTMMVVTGDLAVAIGNHQLHVQVTDRAGNISQQDRNWGRASKPSAPDDGLRLPISVRTDTVTSRSASRVVAGIPAATSPVAPAASPYQGMVSAWVRNPGVATGGILSVRMAGGTCALRGYLAVVGLECTIDGVTLAPAFGSLGSLAAPDSAWHLVTIAFTGGEAQLWIDGRFADRTGRSATTLLAIPGLGAAPSDGSYQLDTIRINPF